MRIFILIFTFISLTQSYGETIELDPLTARVLKCNFCAGYDGPGGPCYKGAGGTISTHPRGYCYSGIGGPLYDGKRGPLDTTPGGVCSMYPGDNCDVSPKGTGENCSLACRLHLGTK